MANPRQPTAIVTDGLWRKSLSAIRSLGRAGFRVVVMGDSFLTTGFWSSYTTTRIKAPVAADDPDGFGEELVKLARSEASDGPVVLLPMEDASLLWAARNLSELEPYTHSLLPPLASLETCQSKAETLKAAAALDLPIPKTVYCDTFAELRHAVDTMPDQQFVAKPYRGTGSSGIVYGNSMTAKGWQKHFETFGPLLVQDRIPPSGDGLGTCFLIGSDGACLGSFAYKRLKQYPITGGPSTDRISIKAPELLERGLALLKRLEWRGVAMVEWKDDPRDGIPKLMEINPRFWGSLELATRSGVDFPALYAAAALNEALPPVNSYKLGIRCRWVVPGDILRYLSQSRNEREGLRQFFTGFLSLSEEWNKDDLSGLAASWICVALRALNPKFWRYLR